LASRRLSGSIASIAEDLAVCTRGLNKRAIREIGQSPKTILRYARLQAALRCCHPDPSSPADSEELLMQFHDRSHVNAEFRSLTGFTPREYRQAKQRSGGQLLNMVYLDATRPPAAHA
jgi:AraC-like DNA-binding protein